MARKGKKEEKKEMRTETKWVLTVVICLFTPFFVGGFILYRSFLVKMLTNISGFDDKEQDKMLDKIYPTNTSLPPYDDGKNPDPTQNPANTKPFTTYLPDNKADLQKKVAAEALKRAGVNPKYAKAAAAVMAGGKKKKRKQRGGSAPQAPAKKKRLPFMSLNNYGFPYDLKESEYWFISGWGDYFVDFMAKNREFEKKYVKLVSNIFYPEERVVPGENADWVEKITFQIFDALKLIVGLGFTDIIKYGLFLIWNVILLFWCAFSSNPFMWIPLLIFGIFQLVTGALTAGFFPFQFYTIMAASSILSPSEGKWKLFRQIVRMYRYIWFAMIWVIIGVSIPSIWGWTTANEDPNWLPIICAWIYPPMIFLMLFVDKWLNLNIFPETLLELV